VHAREPELGIVQECLRRIAEQIFGVVADTCCCKWWLRFTTIDDCGRREQQMIKLLLSMP